MAKTVINLSDPVSTLVTKTNDISNDVGDTALLITGDSNVVDAINTVRNIVVPFDDSDEIKAIFKSGISANAADSAHGVSITFDSASGTFGLSQDYHFKAGAGLDYDSAGKFNISNLGVTTAMIANTNVTNGKIASNTLTSAKFNSAVSLQILDSDGTVLKTLFSPGS
tara:strand:+ start:168 stop:671 length:504 start_codon:yes stop_codon:yes gene_type:complete